MKIMCVDDDPMYLKIYETTISKACSPDDELYFVDTGKKALEMIKATCVDVIITDLILPDTTGIDILRAAKQLNCRTEIIVVTGQGSVDSAVEAMKLGARDYVSKPINTGMLESKLENIRELLRRSGEAEEYRYAMASLEDAAARQINSLETQLYALTEKYKKIRAVFKTDKSDFEKTDTIRTILDSIESNK